MSTPPTYDPPPAGQPDPNAGRGSQPYPNAGQPGPYRQPPYGQQPGQQRPYRQQPSFGQQPPPYGQQPAGQQQPAFSQQPPPYGQQPIGQQPIGQQPPQFGQQPSMPPASYEPPGFSGGPRFALPSLPRGRFKLIRFGIAAVVVVVGIVVGIIQFNSSPAGMSVGDCAKVTGTTSDPNATKTDCSDSAANYKVAKKLSDTSDSCPSDSYDTYTETGSHSSDTKLCLMLNAKEGDCFSHFTDQNAMTLKVSCSDSSAEIKITKVINGSANESACPNSSGISYPDPATTLCATKTSGT